MILEPAAVLLESGYLVLKGLFDEASTQAARQTVLRNADLFRNTRPNPAPLITDALLG